MPGSNYPPKKPPIFGESHGLSDEEAAYVQEMIQEAQQSSRQLSIPQSDLDAGATTKLNPAAAEIINASKVRPILNRFNRDFLYGQGRFDEYQGGLLLKWGDGYSRKHIWVSVEGDNLLFEKSHYKRCDKPYCNGTHHVLSRDLWTNTALVNEELGDCFRRPVHEASDD
jgi:CDGSH-type Zn-finger protein